MNATDSLAAGTLADRIGRALAVPYTIKGNEVRVGASIGISLYSAETAGSRSHDDARPISRFTARRRTVAIGFRFHNGLSTSKVHERVTFATSCVLRSIRRA